MKFDHPWIKKLPIVVSILIVIVSIIISIRSFCNWLLLLLGQLYDYHSIWTPLGDPMQFGWISYGVHILILVSGWLFTTKIKPFNILRWKTFLFINMMIGMISSYAWLATIPVVKKLIPYLEARVLSIQKGPLPITLFLGNTDNLMTVIAFLPSVGVFLVILWMMGVYLKYADELKEAFETFEWTSYRLQPFSRLQEDVSHPDIVLGKDSKTKEYVIQYGKDRTLNNLIIGSIGSGKTSALALPIINQDLHWMTRFINDFPNIYHREDYHSENVKGKYLNGITIIEPSNDLCKKALQLVKAHKIPEQAVYYIDPTNPNTPNINPMKGPVDKVAEAFAMVMEGLSENSQSNFFFQQSQRNHLKQYIYLLKLHDPDKQVTFDDLIDMYNNPQLVYRMHQQLKKRIPKDIDSIPDRDKRNEAKILKSVDEWFDLNLIPKKIRTPNGEITEYVKKGPFYGDPVVIDAQAEYVRGLRNILNDISSNILIRRVLFGESDFDFDRHLEYGGILLVNTAKGELAGLSNILGKIVLLSLQNAVFRRPPNISTYHHILIDEFPDYIYRPFKEFPAQSRKYKVIVTVIAQTIAQLADEYGDKYMQQLLGTLRHKMVYGDVPDFDAEVFSNIFGEIRKYEESESEQSVSPTQDNPMTRSGMSYKKTKEAILSKSDIIYQKAFQCAVKLVVNNRPMPARQIDANFVPEEEFQKAKFTVKGETGKYWWEEQVKAMKSIRSSSDERPEDTEENDNELYNEIYQNGIADSTSNDISTDVNTNEVAENKQDVNEVTIRSPITLGNEKLMEMYIPAGTLQAHPRKDYVYIRKPKAVQGNSTISVLQANEAKEELNHLEKHAGTTAEAETPGVPDSVAENTENQGGEQSAAAYTKTGEGHVSQDDSQKVAVTSKEHAPTSTNAKVSDLSPSVEMLKNKVEKEVNDLLEFMD
jgi:hypothetical protein